MAFSYSFLKWPLWNKEVVWQNALMLAAAAAAGSSFLATIRPVAHALSLPHRCSGSLGVVGWFESGLFQSKDYEI